uniref:K Homology domain-containing protein n=1 Tax=Corethron hystrix TaxID=216773 RepID=A0A7S1BMC0_9STRA|mmetsp:Transcript_34070/g.78647  ORF Transcript_34070/g.78647 Transcript_34070/m.78647 type:complete len:246 (+) Transcript_34070:268-1005(+)
MSLQQQHSSTGSHHKHRAPPPNSTPASTAGANNSSSSAQQQETVVDPVETQLNRLLAITDDDDDGPSQQQQQRQTQQTQTETQQPQQQQQQQQQQQRSRRNQQNRRQYHNDGGVHHHHGGMNNIAAMYESGDIIPNTGVDSGGVGSSRRQYASTLKVLLSNNLAGSIIGRNGQSISDLQARSGCRIKLSQSGDTFPGTGERVCLIQGEGVNAVREAVALVLAKVRDAKVWAFLSHVENFQYPIRL